MNLREPAKLAAVSVGNVTSNNQALNWLPSSSLAESSPSTFSCGSRYNCVAVGEAFDFSTDGGIGWAGATVPPMPDGWEMVSVSCASAMFCMTVGTSSPATPQSSPAILITANGGATWTIVGLPSQFPIKALRQVSCPSVGNCVVAALGVNVASLIIVTSDSGSTWSNGSPTIANFEDFNSLKCLPGGLCIVAGNTYNGYYGPFLLVSNDGGLTWNAPALPSQINNNVIFSVTCASSSDCVAAGSVLIYTTDGGVTWSLSKVSSTVVPNYFEWVLCGSPTMCLAVGDANLIGGQPPQKFSYVSTDGGATWNPYVGVPALSNSNLEDTACISPGICWSIGTVTSANAGPLDLSCWAEGQCIASGGNQVMESAVSENAQVWKNENLPSSSSTDNYSAAACSPSGNTCVAVGSMQSGPYDAEGVASSSSGPWQTSTFTGITTNVTLFSVSCPTDGKCIAMGVIQGFAPFTTDAVYTPIAYVSSDGGNTWTQGNIPGGLGDDVIYSMSCPSPSDCVAVGYYRTQKSLNVMTFAGMSLYTNDGGLNWQVGTMPSGVQGISAVSCPTASDCMAVGGGAGIYGYFSTIVTSSDGGKTWMQEPTPSTVQLFNSVSCSSSTNCVVGGITDVNVGTGVIYSTTDFGRSLVLGTVPVGFLSPTSISCLVGSTFNCTAMGPDLSSFAFLHLAPQITSIAPPDGPPSGGTSVVISGVGLDSAAGVFFGTSPAQSFTVLSDTSISAVSPAGVGTSDVTVTTPVATSQTNSNDLFSYVKYTSIEPARVCDTRNYAASELNNPCNVNGASALQPGQILNVSVVRALSGVPADAVAVTANITVTDTTSSGYLTVWPQGEPQPLASTLNFAPNNTVANLVNVGVSPSGMISIYNFSGSTDVIVDIVGYTAPVTISSNDGFVVPIAQFRVCDTRPANPPSIASNECNASGGQKLASKGSLSLSVAPAGVPTGASAVVANVTVTDTTGSGFLTVFSGAPGSTPPLASNLNYVSGQTVANSVVVPVDPTTGDIIIYNYGSDVDIIVDVTAYLTGPSGTGSAPAVFSPITPVRICDTRTPSPPNVMANQCDTNGNTTLGPASFMTVQVAGLLGIPSDAQSVVLNVTVTNTTSAGFLNVFPTTGSVGTSQPNTSAVNWSAGEQRANLVYAKVGQNQSVTFYNALGTTDVVVDVEGYFQG